MSWTLSCAPASSPLEARMAALSTRELPVTIMDSGFAQAPAGAVSWACKRPALAAVNASATETSFRITQIYTSRFGGGPRCERPYRLDNGAAGELLTSGPVCSLRLRFFLRLRTAAKYAEIELLTVCGEVHFDLVALGELGEQDLLGERVLDVLLDRSLQRACSELLVVAVLHQERRCRLSELQGELFVTQSLLHILEQDRDNLGDVLLRQRMEDDYVIESVEELGVKGVLHLFLHLLRDSLEVRFLVGRVEAQSATLGDVASSNVRRHDHDGVLKVDNASVVIGQMSFIQHLQQDVEDIRMRFLDFVEQHYAVRFARSEERRVGKECGCGGGACERRKRAR